MTNEQIQAALDMIVDFCKKRRHELGLTQSELADKASLGESTIKRFELKKFVPDGKSLLKICSALDCYFFFAAKDSDEPIVEAMRNRWNRPGTNN
jgi:transcriptional regulator with XRE-family HTH domain